MSPNEIASPRVSPAVPALRRAAASRGVVALAWALLAALLPNAARAQAPSASVGTPAPAFRLPAYANPGGIRSLGLTNLVGPEATDKDAKVVLLSFMASFCAPCKKEMPYLQRLHETYGADGLRVVMVSIDTEPEGMAIIDGLIAEHAITYPVLKDRFNIVARRYLGAQSPLPSVFVVGRDGRVMKVHRGYSDEASAVFQREVEDALGIPAGASRLVAATASAAAPETAAVEDRKAAKKKARKRRAKASASAP